MSRLLTLLRWETTIQFRLGIFYAAAAVTAMWALILIWLPEAAVEPLLVSIHFIDLGVFGFFFMPGIYYLEKGDRVLEGLVVTPLRTWEYLSVKVVVLSLAAFAVGAAVTLVVYGTALNWLWFTIGILAMSYPISLLGFIIAARFNGISEYLVPGALMLAVLQLPLLTYFEIVPAPFLYILPSGPGMIFLTAAFGSIPLWLLIFALLYTGLLCVAGTRLAQRTLQQVIARQVGG